MGDTYDLLLSKECLAQVSVAPAGIQPAAAQPLLLYLKRFNRDIRFSCLWYQKRDSHMHCPVWPKHSQQNEQALVGCRAAHHPASDARRAVCTLVTPLCLAPALCCLLTTGPFSSLRGICVLASWLPSLRCSPFQLPLQPLGPSPLTVVLTGEEASPPERNFSASSLMSEEPSPLVTLAERPST